MADLWGLHDHVFGSRQRQPGTHLGTGCRTDFPRDPLKDAKNRRLRYPPERCRTVVDAMVAFRIAYRLTHDPDGLVIPALLEPNQLEHDFDPTGALMFGFDFQGCRVTFCPL